MKKVGPFVLPLFRSALFIVVGWFFAMVTNQSLEQASRWWPIICMVCNIITIALLVVVCRYEGSTYRRLIGYKKGQGNPKYMVMVSVMMLALGVTGTYGFGYLFYGYAPVPAVQPLPVWLAYITIILFPVTNVLAELPLYLGYSLNRIEKVTGNTRLSIVYVTVFYALQHSFIPLLADWKYILFSFVSVLPLVVMITLLYGKNRKLASLMVGHAVLDGAVAFQILLTSLFCIG